MAKVTLPLGRRAALLGLASTAAPLGARAQVTPLPPSTVTPAQPPVVAAPAPAAPARPVVMPASAIDKTKAYYVYFDLSIDLNSMRALRRQMTALVEAEVSRIVLVINSAGGAVIDTLFTYSFLRSLPVQLSTHAQAVIASAATILFLAGDDRTADTKTLFLFHPTQVPLGGLMNEQQMQEQATQLRAVDDRIGQIYRERTKFTQDQVEQFQRREVIYTAEQAKELGVVQSVGDLKLPGPETARVVFVD